MKKLLLASASLLLFAFAITIFQISCRKDAMAQNNPENIVILYQKRVPTQYGIEWWVCSEDGSNQRKVNFPANIIIRQLGVSLMPDKNSVVFSASENSLAAVSNIYTMNIDGTNLQKIVSTATDDFYSPLAYK